MSLSTQIIFALITCFFSFGVQAIFFLSFKLSGSKLIKKEKTVFNYLSGVIGDSTLIPLTNIFAIQTLIYTQTYLNNFPFWILAIIIGFAITFISHYYQQKSNLTTWTMPKAGEWNILGLYHAIFMFSETSFLAYVLISQISFILSYGINMTIYYPIKYAFLALSLFLLTFFYDYRKEIIGKKS